MDHLEWDAVRSGVLVPPLPHRRDHWPQVTALVGQPIFESRWVFGVGHLDQHAGLDKTGEPLIQDVPGDTEARLQLVKTPDPQKCVTDDQ